MCNASSSPWSSRVEGARSSGWIQKESQNGLGWKDLKAQLLAALARAGTPPTDQAAQGLLRAPFSRVADRGVGAVHGDALREPPLEAPCPPGRAEDQHPPDAHGEGNSHPALPHQRVRILPGHQPVQGGDRLQNGTGTSLRIRARMRKLGRGHVLHDGALLWLVVFPGDH